MKILFFGRLKEITGSDVLEVKNIKNLSSLRTFIINKYPRLKDEVFAVAVNLEIVNEDIELNDNDEIALLPPIAGG